MDILRSAVSQPPLLHQSATGMEQTIACLVKADPSGDDPHIKANETSNSTPSPKRKA